MANANFTRKQKLLIILLCLFIVILASVAIYSVVNGIIQISNIAAGKLTYFDSYGEHTLTFQHVNLTGLIVNMAVTVFICTVSIIISVAQIKHLKK